MTNTGEDTRPTSSTGSCLGAAWRPAIGCWKSAAALKTGGVLAAIYPHHIRGCHLGFWQDSQVCYLKWGLSHDPDWRPPDAHEAPHMYPDIDACPTFWTVERHRVPKTLTYTRDEYVWAQLRTDSLILTLPQPDREGFLADIAQLIDMHYDGVVSRDYLYEVVIGQKG